MLIVILIIIIIIIIIKFDISQYVMKKKLATELSN